MVFEFGNDFLEVVEPEGLSGVGVVKCVPFQVVVLGDQALVILTIKFH